MTNYLFQMLINLHFVCPLHTEGHQLKNIGYILKYKKNIKNSDSISSNRTVAVKVETDFGLMFTNKNVR